MIRTAVFDVDDTLYLERDYVLSGFDSVDRWLTEQSLTKGFAHQARLLFEAGCRGQIFNRALAVLGVDDTEELIEAMVSRYRTHVPNISLARDAVDLLDRLVTRCTCSAITDGPVDSQHAKVKALGLERWLSPIVVTGDLGPGKGKPAKDAFLIVEQETGSVGNECVYIADNPTKDFAGPRLLGWSTIRIRRQYGLHARLESGPDIDRETDSLVELDRILEAL